MREITAYMTEDGKVWHEKKAADRHEEFLKHSNIVDQFLDSDMNQYRGPQRVIAKNSIINWQMWSAKNVK